MAMNKAKDLVSSNAVVVFSKSFCPYCLYVKKLLNQLGVAYKVFELDTLSDGPELKFLLDMYSALVQWTRQKTVPYVFIGGKLIGCFRETVRLHEEGKLVPLLTEARADEVRGTLALAPPPPIGPMTRARAKSYQALIAAKSCAVADKV